MDQERAKEIRTVGTRIHYSGDMANSESFGTVTQVFENDKFNYNQIEITFDDERFEGDNKMTIVPLMGFYKGPGCRFSLKREHDAKYQEAMDKYMALASK
jgi:hypothetical protein